MDEEAIKITFAEEVDPIEPMMLLMVEPITILISLLGIIAGVGFAFAIWYVGGH